MDITALHPRVAAETTRLIRSNSRSIFCRGIFRPACELGDDEMPWSNVDPECCFATVDRDQLLGVAGTIVSEDALELFLLEAEREPRSVEIAERLLHSDSRTIKAQLVNRILNQTEFPALFQPNLMTIANYT